MMPHQPSATTSHTTSASVLNRGREFNENVDHIDENLKNRNSIIENVAVPVDEIVSIFPNFEDYLLLLLEKINIFHNGKTTEKIGNTTLELYLDRLDLVRTNIENSNNGNESDAEFNINESPTKKNEEKESKEKLIQKINLNEERILKLKMLEEKILNFLDSESTYDKSHALLLCTSFRFRKGELFLLDR